MSNTAIIYGVEESEVVRASSALRTEESLVESITTDLSHLAGAQSADTGKIMRLEGLLSALQATVFDSPEDLVDQFVSLHRGFPDEFAIFGCIDMLPSMLRQAVKKASKAWSPRTDHYYLIDLYRSCSQLVTYFEQCDETHLAGLVTTALAGCVEGSFLSTARRFVASEWEPTQDETSLCFKLFEVLHLVLTDRAFSETVDLVLLPKLKDAVSSIRLGTDNPVLPRVWLLPWQSLLGSKLDALHAPLLQKFSAFLSSSSWRVRDEWVSDELRAWRPVLDKRAWTKLVVQCVVPKLVSSMHSDFDVDPSAQDLSVFTAVLRFDGVIPREHMECLLLGEFFGKWLQVLARWVRLSSCDLLEITHWCAGWRAVFPDSMLTSSSARTVSLSVPFAIALDLVESSLDVKVRGDRGQLARFDDIVSRFAGLTYGSLLKTMTLEHDIQRRVDHLANSATSTTSYSRDGREGGSLREMVETLAEKNGVMFLPKPGKLIEGKQVWQFGKDIIYLEHHNVVTFTTVLGVSSWMPIALDDLLLRNQQN
eukprot:gene21632-27671_t